MKRAAALPATLFALAMTSGMAVGGMYVARRHVVSTQDHNAAASLLPAAERAAISVLTAWDTLARSHQSIGPAALVDSGPDASVWITRTAASEYLVVAEAISRTRPALHHRIGLSVVIRAGQPQLPFPRAWVLLP